MKPTLRVVVLLCFAVVAILALSSTSFAQKYDIAVGGGSMSAAPASQADSSHSTQTLAGGSYFSVSGDRMLRKTIGVEAEVAWKGSRGTYFPGGFNQPYRPFYFDANALWVPPLTKRISAELMAGVGDQYTRFYRGIQVCQFVKCINYSTSNHFVGHFGGGLKVYAFHKIFVRPEVDLYLVKNNVEFSSDRAIRYGVSIGYTF